MTAVTNPVPTTQLRGKGVGDEFDPRTSGIGLLGKFAIFIAGTVLAASVTNPEVLAPILALALIITLTTGLKWKAVLTALKPIAPVIVLLFVLSGLFFDTTTSQNEFARTVFVKILHTNFLSLSISSGGLLFGLGVDLKLLLVMIVSIYLISTTPTEQLLAGLQALRVPNAIGLMMSTAVRFIPTMSSEVSTIKDAQRARGAGSSKQPRGRGQAVQGTLPLFVPMIVTSMRRADTMAMSMVSRGYGFTKNRTILTRLHLGVWDYLAVVVVTLGLVAYFIVRAQTGFGIL